MKLQASYGIRSERRLCEEVHLNLAYRWFCRLGLDSEVPDHSTFSKNRHARACLRLRAIPNGSFAGFFNTIGHEETSFTAQTKEKDRLAAASL